jgi:hypothetical protein
MSKTPEELAEEYALFGKSDLPNSVWKSQKIAAQKFDFLAGYQAAKETYEARIKELEIELDNWQHAATHGDEGL